MRNKSLGRECDPVFVPRNAETFSVGPNSHIRKIQRWFDRGGGMPAIKAPARPQGIHRVKPARAAATYRGARRNAVRARRAAFLAAKREGVAA